MIVWRWKQKKITICSVHINITLHNFASKDTETALQSGDVHDIKLGLLWLSEEHYLKTKKHLIWLVTYLHVLLIIKRNTKFKSMEFKWFCYGTITSKIGMYALLNICIYYIYICNYCTFDFLIWHWKEV